MERATPRMALVSASPSGPGGVPTQTKTTSEESMASWKSSVKRRLPLVTPAVIRGSSPGSWKGATPEVSCWSLAASDSTPITSWPTWARQAATTEPT